MDLTQLRELLETKLPRWLVVLFLGPQCRWPASAFLGAWCVWGLLVRTFIDSWFPPQAVTASAWVGLITGMALVLLGWLGFASRS